MLFGMNLLLTVSAMVAVCVTVATCEREDLSRKLYSRSPALELYMHLPPMFANVDAFQTFLGLKPERRRRDVNALWRRKRETSTEKKDAQEINMEAPVEPLPDPAKLIRSDAPSEGLVDSPTIYVEPYPNFLELRHGPGIEMLASNSRFGSDQDSDNARKTRTTSADEDERGYPEQNNKQERTTTSPFWKKENKPDLPFVTGSREGRQYDRPQHRAGESGRESHSMKDPSKPVASNEIPRMGDSYYSASSNGANSRAYSSRPDSPPPKSVYDTIDYSARRGQARAMDTRGRLSADAYGPPPYDRYYYPMGGEIAGRGVEYYHRSIDPGTGRIVYYASLPEPEAYRASRTYAYDAYGRSFPPFSAYPSYPYPYNPYNPYMTYQPYSSSPPQDFARSARYQQQPLPPVPSLQPIRYDRYDDVRNKTYVIYDAEEKRALNSYIPKPIDDRNRYAPPLPYPGFPVQPPYQPYQPYPVYNSYSGYNAFSRGGYMDQRGLVKQVELPLTSKAALKPVTT